MNRCKLACYFCFKKRHKSGTKRCKIFIVYMATKRNFVVIRHKYIAFITGTCGNNAQKLGIFKKMGVIFRSVITTSGC
jgi:hypothetical protein